MAESPIFIAENMGALMALTSTATASGYPKENAIDNLHYTECRANAAGNFTLTFDPVTAAVVDCAVIHTNFTDAAGYFIVTRNGSSVLNTNGSISITEGAHFLKFASGPITVGQTLTIQLVTTLVAKIKHACPGIQLQVKNPLAPFDPEAVEQPMNQFFGRSGVMAKNSPIYTKKQLELNYENLGTTDYTSLLALYNKAYLKGLPFWFFFRPTTQPKAGYLYEFEQDGFQMPFTLGNYRSCQIRAKANYSPDRSTATL